MNEEEIFSIVRANLGLSNETRFKVKHGSQLDFKKLKCQAKVPSSRSFARVKFRNKTTDRVLCVFVCQEELPGIHERERCNKLFRKWHNLFDHMRTHTNERPFRCPVDGCDDAFKQYSNQLKHLVTHKTQGNLPCRVCKQEYPRKKIIEHFTAEHPNKL